MTDIKRLHIRCSENFINTFKELVSATGYVKNRSESYFKKGSSDFVRELISNGAIYIKSAEKPARYNKNDNRSNLKQIRELSMGQSVNLKGGIPYSLEEHAKGLPALLAQVSMLDADVSVLPSESEVIEDEKINQLIMNLQVASKELPTSCLIFRVTTEQFEVVSSMRATRRLFGYGYREALIELISTSLVRLVKPERVIDHRAIRLKAVFDSMNSALIDVHQKNLTGENYLFDLARLIKNTETALSNELTRTNGKTS